MRAAAPRAASRRGSSTMILPPLAHAASSKASGTRVVLPAPGGASSTRFGAAASAPSISGINGSIGRSVTMRALMARQVRGSLHDPPRESPSPKLGEGWGGGSERKFRRAETRLPPPYPPPYRGRRWLPRQVIQDRAIRPVVAVAVVGEVLQRAHHCLHLGNLALQVRDVAFSEILHLGGRTPAVAPQCQQRTDR